MGKIFLNWLIVGWLAVTGWSAPLSGASAAGTSWAVSSGLEVSGSASGPPVEVVMVRPRESFTVSYPIIPWSIRIPSNLSFAVRFEDEFYWYFEVGDGQQAHLIGWPKVEVGPVVRNGVLSFRQPLSRTFKQAFHLVEASQTYPLVAQGEDWVTVRLPSRRGSAGRGEPGTVEVRVPRQAVELSRGGRFLGSALDRLARWRSEARTRAPVPLPLGRQAAALLYLPGATGGPAVGFRAWMDGNHYAVLPARPDHQYPSQLVTAEGQELSIRGAEETGESTVARLLLAPGLSPALLVSFTPGSAETASMTAAATHSGPERAPARQRVHLPTDQAATEALRAEWDAVDHWEEVEIGSDGRLSRLALEVPPGTPAVSPEGVLIGIVGRDGRTIHRLDQAQRWRLVALAE